MIQSQNKIYIFFKNIIYGMSIKSIYRLYCFISDIKRDRVLKVASFGALTSWKYDFVVKSFPTEFTNFDRVSSPHVHVVGDVSAPDIQSIKNYQSSFDLVIVAGLLQYPQDYKQVLLNASHLLRHSGLLILDIPQIMPFIELEDKRRFSHYEVESLVPGMTLVTVLGDLGLESLVVSSLFHDFAKRRTLALVMTVLPRLLTVILLKISNFFTEHTFASTLICVYVKSDAYIEKKSH